MQVIQGWDSACQPTIRSIDDALRSLRSRGYDFAAGDCRIEVPRSALDRPCGVARLTLTAAADRDDIRVDFPTLRGCRALTTGGTPIDLALEAFDQADVDGLGNVLLRDGRSVHAVTFDVVGYPRWTELDEAIIWLTIRAFKAEHIFVRRHPFMIGIDYGILHIMREPNVKELTNYINEHIGQLPRAEGERPFRTVPISRIQRTLDIAGIRKVRGRRRASQHN
ncbi:MAG: hypothetical protein Q8M26_08330 [Pseudolabrys sp.]|nr:hypothetical protein [Pseudolabrys sp.]